MKIKNNAVKIIKRFNNVMNDINCEHLAIVSGGELEYVFAKEGKKSVTIKWMREEAEYWLSCYYEKGNVRCDDRLCGEEEYKLWRSETGKLKRLIECLLRIDDSIVVAEIAE